MFLKTKQFLRELKLSFFAEWFYSYGESSKSKQAYRRLLDELLKNRPASDDKVILTKMRLAHVTAECEVSSLSEAEALSTEVKNTLGIAGLNANPEMSAQLLLVQGRVAQRRGDFSNAVHAYLNAHDIYAKLKLEYVGECCSAADWLAESYFEQGDVQNTKFWKGKAENYKAIAMARYSVMARPY